MKKLLLGLLAALFLAPCAFAQNSAFESSASSGTPITVVGTPSNGQLTLWTGANSIQGVTILPAANFPALTGDVTSGAGGLTTALATVNSNVGNFGSATQVGSFTVNGKGLITAASAVTITPPFSAITGVATPAQLPVATTSALGAVQPDGTTITISAGVISAVGGGSGTVTSFSVVTANGVSASVANPTTTPAATFTLGAITPSSVAIGAGSAITSSGPGGVLGSNAFTSTAYAPIASPTFTGTQTLTTALATTLNGNTLTTGTGTLTLSTFTLTAAGNGSVSGTNTGDQTITLTGGVTGSGTGSFAATVVTNANLTGPITSVGNATTITSSVALPGSPTTTTQTASDNSTKVSTTAYVTTAIANALSGVNPAVAVSAATTAAGNTSAWTYANGTGGVGATFTGPTNTAIVIDGFTFTTITTQSLLVKNDTQSPSGAFNGVYVLTALQTVGTGAIFTRRLDYDQPSDINSTGAIPVVNGTANATTSWLITSTVNTVGTDPLTYTQFSVAPSTLLTATAPTNHGVLLGAGTQAVNATGAGTAGQVLTSNGASSDPTFQAPSSGAMVLISTQTASSSASISFTGLSGYSKYKIIFENVVPSGASEYLQAVLGTGAGPSYITSSTYYGYAVFASTGSAGARNNTSAAAFVISDRSNTLASTSTLSGEGSFSGFTNGGFQYFHSNSYCYDVSAPLQQSYMSDSILPQTTAITAIQFSMSGGNITSGKFSLYGITQ